jgi:hypothetical protein
MLAPLAFRQHFPDCGTAALIVPHGLPKSILGKRKGPVMKDFFLGLLRELGRLAGALVIAFAIGTGAGAVVCAYAGIPLIFSLAGGILVLGIWLFLASQSSLF